MQQHVGSLWVRHIRYSQKEQWERGEDIDHLRSSGRINFDFAFDALQLLQAVADSFQSVRDAAAAFQAYEDGGGKQREALDFKAFFGSANRFRKRAAVAILVHDP